MARGHTTHTPPAATRVETQESGDVMTTPSSSHRHLCLDLSPAAIRDHFAFVGDSSIVEALSDEDLVAAAEAWLDEGSDEPWASYDRFCRAICVRAREAAVAQGACPQASTSSPHLGSGSGWPSGSASAPW